MTNQAWAEGDALSPTNLNARLSGAVTTKTYYAKWAAGTGTTQINNAITNAAALGFSYCHLDASQIPYDATQVSFNAAVQMTREGGFAAADGLDVFAYGGYYNSDLQPALQACLTLCNSLTGKRVVLIDGSNSPWKVNKPSQIIADGTKIRGVGVGKTSGGSTTIQANFAGGPIFVAANTSATVPTTTALLTGTGFAMNWPANSTSVQVINLRDLPTCELNGLAAFGFRTTFTLSATNTFINFGCSSGRFLNNDPQTQAFRLFKNSSDAVLRGSIHLSGGTVNVSGGTITAGATHTAEINYDGTNVRLLLDGVVVQTSAGSGTVVQGVAEDITLGYEFNTSPEQGTSGYLPNELVQDSTELSKVARHIANYTPETTKYTFDSNTLAGLNWDTFFGTLTQVYTNIGNAWVHYRADSLNRGINDVAFEDITLADSGLFIDPIYNYGVNTNIGVILTNPCFKPQWNHVWGDKLRMLLKHLEGGYMGHFNNITIEGGPSRYGMIFGTVSGQQQLDTLISSVGGQIALIYASCPMLINNAFLQTTLAATTAAYISNGATSDCPFVVQNFGISTEVGTPPGWRGCFLGAGSTHFVLVGGGMETGHSTETTPHIVLDSCRGVQGYGVRFQRSGSQTEYIHNQGSQSPITLSGCFTTDNGAAWTTSGTLNDIRLPSSTMTATATPVFDCAKYQSFSTLLAADVTSSTLSVPFPGQTLSWIIQQDSSGSHAWAWPSNVSGAPSIFTAANGVTVVTALVSGTTAYVTSVRTIV